MKLIITHKYRYFTVRYLNNPCELGKSSSDATAGIHYGNTEWKSQVIVEASRHDCHVSFPEQQNLSSLFYPALLKTVV
jgi:hypothetical protein